MQFNILIHVSLWSGVPGSNYRKLLVWLACQQATPDAVRSRKAKQKKVTARGEGCLQAGFPFCSAAFAGGACYN
jgi:hypothetical protein